jgi:hypothetical protein
MDPATHAQGAFRNRATACRHLVCMSDMFSEPALRSNHVIADGDLPVVDSRKPAASGFLISLGVHAVVLFIFSLVVLVAEQLEEETAPIRVVQIDAPPPKEQPAELQRSIESSDLAIEVESETESERTAPLTPLDLPLSDDSEREDHTRDDALANNAPRGREEGVAEAENGGQGAFMAIGAGGGSSGAFGSRTGSGKKRALGIFGGNKASENAVETSLRWFKKHQSPDGRWGVRGYEQNCPENPKCEPSTCAASVSDAMGDPAATGMALLCFLGAGYDHRMPSPFRVTVKRGIDYLLKLQGPTGYWGVHNYENAIATMAMAEAYAMTQDPALKDSAQRGVDQILVRQNSDPAKPGDPYAKLGWYYMTPFDSNDSSVTAWQVQALKSAAAAGLNIGEGMNGAKKWLRKAWEAANPDWQKITDPYNATSLFPYQWVLSTNAATHTNRQALGALCAVFLGHKEGDILLESLCNAIMKGQVPTKWPCHVYYMYYNTLTIFQVGGKRWETWNKTVRDILVNAQRKDAACFDGSWDYSQAQGGFADIGRLMVTGWCCLSLEVYYRYLPVSMRDGRNAAK